MSLCCSNASNCSPSLSSNPASLPWFIESWVTWPLATSLTSFSPLLPPLFHSNHPGCLKRPKEILASGSPRMLFISSTKMLFLELLTQLIHSGLCSKVSSEKVFQTGFTAIFLYPTYPALLSFIVLKSGSTANYLTQHGFYLWPHTYCLSPLMGHGLSCYPSLMHP